MHGIRVPLPLSPHIAMRRVLERISVDKDVDGFVFYSVRGLPVGSTVFPPCTPYGVQKLLEHERVEIAGRDAVGEGNIVGTPTAMLLLQQDATVCITLRSAERTVGLHDEDEAPRAGA